MNNSHENRWQAVLNRDRAQDDQFVYAVISTGIYCRPSCPSRRPGPGNVLFFDTPAQAEQSGFRACRRCRPNADPANPAHVRLAQNVARYLEENDGEKITLNDLAVQFDTSPYHLQRIFKQIIGVTPRQYASARRERALKTHLRKSDTITRAAFDAGYGSTSQFYDSATERLGMSPANYRNGGHNMQIAYTIIPCPLGFLLIAATAKGICAVRLGDEPAALEAALRLEFPAAHLLLDDSALARQGETVLAYLRGEPADLLALPLDIAATAFQERVWQALRAIPYGQTRTYAQIAREIQQPNATRAVAHACASNPVALVIPCHRVIGSDGALHGYRWGKQRKQSLLQMEGRPVGQENPG